MVLVIVDGGGGGGCGGGCGGGDGGGGGGEPRDLAMRPLEVVQQVRGWDHLRPCGCVDVGGAVVSTLT